MKNKCKWWKLCDWEYINRCDWEYINRCDGCVFLGELYHKQYRAYRRCKICGKVQKSKAWYEDGVTWITLDEDRTKIFNDRIKKGTTVLPVGVK